LIVARVFVQFPIVAHGVLGFEAGLILDDRGFGEGRCVEDAEELPGSWRPASHTETGRQELDWKRVAA